MPLMRAADTLCKMAVLDAVSQLWANVAQALPEKVRDVLHGTWLGHPLHPVLAQLTVGCMTSSAILDVVAALGQGGDGGPGLSGRRRAVQPAGGMDAASGLLQLLALASVPATAAAGAADGSALHTEQQRLATAHAAANVAASVLVGASLLRRRRGHVASARVLNLAGVGIAGLSAGLGGHLAYRWGAGGNHAEAVPHTTPVEWMSIGLLADLPDSQPVSRRIGATPVVAVRHGTTVRVLADACSHLAGPLSEGEVRRIGEQDCIVCPWHGSTFRLSDGGVVHGPATSPQPRFETRIVGEYVQARVVPAQGQFDAVRPLGELLQR